jgi:predicted helicase
MPNLAPGALARLTEYMSVKPEPIEVFDYIYGVLYDPVHREQFNEFLKRDFPRVPVINCEADKDNPDAFYVSEDMFRSYVTAGECLRKLHLMQTKVPAELIIEPNTSEDMEIGAIKYKDGILHLNAKKRILGITVNVWNYRIGGYQVLDKWLKSHKGEALTIDSFEHIANVAGILAETINVQNGLRGIHVYEPEEMK